MSDVPRDLQQIVRKPKGNDCTTDKIEEKAFPEPYRELLFCRCAPHPSGAQGYWNGQHLETSGSGSPSFVVEALSDEKSLCACNPFNELHLSTDHGDDSDDTDETEFGVSSQPHMPDPSGGMPDRERLAEEQEPLQLPEADSGAFLDRPSLQKPML
ncbi:hypothetical protein, conserved [Eimeria necatrix]|uniref:Uncharacterized protein n=1 Tax=Eimeria necatrix TaxID=51315 RepID=U6MQL8_9EIME|nr:hypothetical protein, conserved [Eimeria necatrix]CDJ65373.1 hypothetical protein, conserved [Eimeria necatrix]